MARQAYSLDTLLAEVNALSPKRSKISDGGIGDPAHAARDSDHNPNAADVWRARDFTDDQVDDNDDDILDDVFDCNAFAEALVAMYHDTSYDGDAHPAMRSGAYTIWKGRIYSYDRRDEGWRPYDGSNDHSKHLHQSVATAATGYDSRLAWNLFKETDMPLTKADLDRLGELVDTKIRAAIRAEVPEIVRDEVDAVLDAPMNFRQPGDRRFAGMSVRELFKRIATSVGAVPKP